MSDPNWVVPEHVPEELVVDFDLFGVPEDLKDPIDKWHDLVKAGVPSIFWSPRNGGHWTFLRYDNIRDGYRNYEVFSNRHTPIPPVPEDQWPIFQPQSVDPPDHAKFKMLLSPLFTPNTIRSMEGQIKERCRSLISSFSNQGHCDFVKDFSGRLPTGLFLDIMGMDNSRLDEFVGLADEFMRVEDPEGKANNVAKIYAVLADALESRKQQPLNSDVLSALIQAKEPNGQPFPDDEVLNCMFLLFVAGLDTVTSTMTYIWRYLALNPDAREHIKDAFKDRVRLNFAIDELFRINAVSNIYRRVAKDTIYDGIQLKKDEKVVLPNTVANRDPDIFENHDTIDLDRKINTHVTFGLGPHRCIGSHLAKMEVIAALQEWLELIPEFDLDQSQPVNIFAGPVMGFRHLPLTW